MYFLIRPFLFKLDPERSHALSLQALRLAGKIPEVRWILQKIYSAPQKLVEAFGLKFKNPIGLAAGYDKDGLAMRGLTALGFGHVEIGTVTPQPQLGNPSPRVFRLVEDEAVVNRMGFPSRGAEFLQRRLDIVLQKNMAGCMLGINLGKNKDTPNEEAVLDYLSLLQSFAKYANYLTINVSSPNTVGLRQLQGRAALESLLTQLHHQRVIEEKALQKKLPILVKLAPDLTDAELNDALEAILNANMDGVIVTNTTLAREGLVSKHQLEAGGLSGSPLRLKSEAVLHQTIKLLNGKIPVVSAGGIMNPEDAHKRLEMGAVLVQIYSGMIYYGPGLAKAIARFI